MSGVSRRSFVAIAGAALVVREFCFGVKPARAAFYVKSADDINQCIGFEGGQVTYWTTPMKDGSIGYCGGTFKDRECQEKGYYTKEGDFIKYDVYNRSIKKCDIEDCFITTACVRHIGLSDNCYELRTLRKFRDEVLPHLPQGKDAIKKYYDIAPKIVLHIEESAHAGRELSRLYVLYILPCVVFAKLGLNRLTYRRYKAAMVDLIARFGEELRG